jgi:transcriptional regulator with XRE-family HTH domain
MSTEPSTKRRPGRHRVTNVDRHVSARLRDRRIMLGLSQQQLAEPLGLSHQQMRKYETGMDRITSGRLYHLVAQVLGVDVGYFFEGTGGDYTFMATQQRLLLDFVRCFLAIPTRRHHEGLVSLARALAEPGEPGS